MIDRFSFYTGGEPGVGEYVIGYISDTTILKIDH